MKKLRGFTLIELMLVVAIVSILAAIAFPSYLDYLRKGRRADAHTSLMELKMAQEKFRANCTSYATTLGNANDCATTTIDFEAGSREGYYTISIVSATGNSFVLEADPIGVQASDNGCDPLRLTVNNTNPRGLKEPAGCW